MADFQLVIIGGGLSGLAAGIRAARFGHKVLILEQHWQPGGLNSYYLRKGYLLETGLHAMTNFAPAGVKHAPLNRLFRQLKLSRKKFVTHEQLCSAIHFPDYSLCFSNNLEMLTEEIGREFPGSVDKFQQLVEQVQNYDPFALRPWSSAREFVSVILDNHLLEDMLLGHERNDNVVAFSSARNHRWNHFMNLCLNIENSSRKAPLKRHIED